MARKKKHEDHDNHDRWLVSYADFITLLFAFFVVMYSISSINEGTYRVLSSTLVTAFSHPAKTLDPIQYGTPLRAPIIQHNQMRERDDTVIPRIGIDYQIMPTPGQMVQMRKIADEVKHDLKKLIDEDVVHVNETSKGVEVAINSELLFASGKSHLSEKAQHILQRIAGLLIPKHNQINVEGYTDNVPISTEQFPSNWELSAARAASVVHLFTRQGIKPQRLAAIGFGQYRPVAPNATAGGRKKNRRVSIVILNEPYEGKVNLGGPGKQGGKVKGTSVGVRGTMSRDGVNKGLTTGSGAAKSVPESNPSESSSYTPLSFPINTSDGHPSVVQLPSTRVIPDP